MQTRIFIELDSNENLRAKITAAREDVIFRYIFVFQADDVSFILELIARVAEDHPAADANNVNLIGTSNGAAIIYRLLIATGIDRPFHR